jgi:hypothetical protein
MYSINDTVELQGKKVNMNMNMGKRKGKEKIKEDEKEKTGRYLVCRLIFFHLL